MKRLLSIILVACMLLGTLSCVAPVSAVTHGYLLGDANDDGIISSKDIVAIRRYLAGLEREKNISVLSADVTKDKDVTTDDVIALRKYLVGLGELEGNNTDKEYKINSITIDNKNISRYTIVIPDKDDAIMRYAADRLKAYIRISCGIQLNITDDESSVTGYMIKYQYDPEDKYELGREGYRVAVEDDGNLVFTCGSMRGPLYVTFFFLEEIVGWRFLSNRGIWRWSESRGKMELSDEGGSTTYLYEADNINVPAGYQEKEVPVFEYRAVSQTGITGDNYQMLKVNASDGTGSWRGGYREGGVVGTLFIHAHSYELQCNIKPSQQPCLTKEATYEQIINYNTKLVREREAGGQNMGIKWTQVSCSPNDNTDFCMCAECKRVYQEEGSISGTVFRLSNRVAEAMDKEFPGIEIYTIAYWDARKPPKLTRPLDNVCVCFCIGGCNNHTYDCREDCAENGGNDRLHYKNWNGGDEGPLSNVEDLYYFEQWMELTNNVYIWYYSANFIYYMSPAANLFNVYNDIKYIAAAGAIGIYSEGSTYAYSSFELLRAYMVSKMLWDPFMSEEEYNELFNEYLMIYYGDGWEYIREYLEMADQASDLKGCWTNNFDRPWEMYSEEYFRDNYLKMCELFDKASEATQDTEQKYRIARSRAHCDFLGLSATYERDYVNGDAASKAAYAERYARLYNTVLDRINPYYDWTAKDAYKHLEPINIFSAGSGTLGCENLPSSEKDICSPMTWIFKDFSGYWD